MDPRRRGRVGPAALNAGLGPARRITSSDGTQIAVFTSGAGETPLILIHGASADHTTFRVLAPRLAPWFAVHAIDRRGRGASGDTLPYSIEREYEDVVRVAETIAAETGRPVPVFGHSYGGRCALGAATLTDRISRVISYEGAPAPPGTSYQPADLEADLEARRESGDFDGLLETFMRRVVGMPEAELAAYRDDPIWPRRAAAADTIPRELRAERDPAAGVATLRAVRQPVLQLLGGDSVPVFRTATEALDAALADGRILEIPGARHAAHHTHPELVVQAVRAFMA